MSAARGDRRPCRAPASPLGRGRAGALRGHAFAVAAGLATALLAASCLPSAAWAQGAQGAQARSAPPAAAQEAGPQDGPWFERNPCRAGSMPAPDYTRCLFEATQATDKAQVAAFEAAMAVVEGRTDLAGVQRSRWKSQLDEAQTRFLLFRNFDCQSVAPFEGRRGIGDFEQRSLCLIENNLRRERDLRARYRPLPRPAAPAEPPVAETTHLATWTRQAPPPLD